MGKFPQIVEWFSRVKVQVGKIFNKSNLPIAIAVLAVVVGTYFSRSLPVFYVQAYDGHINEKQTVFALEVKKMPQVAPMVTLGETESIFPAKESELEKELYAMVGDYPIKDMVPYIAKQNKTVAAFIVGIAKKESNWGKRSPTLNGNDCFNYWGYKGAGEKGIAMGHGCFATPEEAVDVIGKRLEQLVGKNLTTPSKMVVWKCGSSCAATGGQAAANKWISDVSVYFNKIVKIDA